MLRTILKKPLLLKHITTMNDKLNNNLDNDRISLARMKPIQNTQIKLSELAEYGCCLYEYNGDRITTKKQAHQPRPIKTYGG